MGDLFQFDFYDSIVCGFAFHFLSDFCQEKFDSAPDCPSRGRLRTNPPPRGFEEFFAKLAKDPLVKVLRLEIFVSFEDFFALAFFFFFSCQACCSFEGLESFVTFFLVATFMAFAEKVS